MNSNCFFFRKRKRPKLKKMSIQWTHCCWLSKHFFKDVKSIQVLSKFKNFQPLFIFVGFCSISRKKPWSIFQKFPNTLWFIFISCLFRIFWNYNFFQKHTKLFPKIQKWVVTKKEFNKWFNVIFQTLCKLDVMTLSIENVLIFHTVLWRDRYQ